MAENIFGSITEAVGIGGVNSGSLVNIAIMGGIVILLLVAVAVGIIVWIMQKKTIKIIEIDSNHRLQTFNGQMNYNPNNRETKIKLGKYKKEINNLQDIERFYKGNRDMAILYKDFNGFHHPVHLLTKEEVAEYFLKVKNVDINQQFIEKEGVKTENPYYNYWQMFAMPNPSEDLNFLGDAIVDANNEYKRNLPWWQSPTVMVIATAFICFMMFAITLIVMKMSLFK